MTEETGYIQKFWPEVQKLQEMEGFEEHSKPCISDNPDEQGSYFIEEEWLRWAQLVIKAKEEGIINLPNRYPSSIVVLLEPINKKKHTYKLVTNSNYLGISSQGEKIVAVDPEGGPYISIGSAVRKRVVTEIVRNEKLKAYIITL